jgi:hypothetical protein
MEPLSQQSLRLRIVTVPATAEAELEAQARKAYSEGRATLAQTALQLGQSPTDAVFWLEERYARGVELIRLKTAERQLILDQIVAERAARNGGPVLEPSLVEREVLASQRIESVDARAWLDHLKR